MKARRRRSVTGLSNLIYDTDGINVVFPLSFDRKRILCRSGSLSLDQSRSPSIPIFTNVLVNPVSYSTSISSVRVPGGNYATGESIEIVVTLQQLELLSI